MSDVESANNLLFRELFKLSIFWKASCYSPCSERNFDKIQKLSVGANFVKLVSRKFPFHVVSTRDVELIINDEKLD